MYRKKNILLFLFLLIINFSVNAQNHEKIILKIDSLAAIGLPKSALLEVQKLDDVAKNNNNAALQIKASV